MKERVTRVDSGGGGGGGGGRGRRENGKISNNVVLPARPMCETKYFIIFFSLHLVLLLPPYQKAGYATNEPLQKKKIVSPPPPPQSKTASGAPVL